MGCDTVRAQLYLHVQNGNSADKMLLLYVYSWGQVFHGVKGVSVIQADVNGTIRSGATGFCCKSYMIYIAHTMVCY